MSDESASPSPESSDGGAPATDSPLIPTDRRSIAHEFKDFIIYNKAWWLTPIVLIVALMVAFILFAESSPVLPFIYTVI
ncbi:MAG: DUF5989 family protein [Myxococcota bacterium]|jgi:hypothetical protein|nr:DUF5989 family protein [Myxococcota bacterium]